MAERILSSVAASIIGTLATPALQEIGLLWGVNNELEKLRDTVSTIQAVLVDAEKQQEQNQTVRTWLEKLKDVLDEADDLVDDVSTEALRREVKTRNKKAKKVRIFFSKSNQLAYGLKLAHKIKAIRERLDAVAADRKFHLDVRPVETQVRSKAREQTHSFVLEEEVIGREDDKEAIIELLLDYNVKENVAILPIIGIGGLGKTTLAQLVFNDEKIQKPFEKKMWVCVSDNFVVKEIVEKILESATGYKTEKDQTLETLVKNLKKEIDRNRYLLVLDDVWDDNLEKWLKLKNLLMGGARGSRILITTRIKGVAEITKTIQPFSLKGLDKHESWSLFKQMAFEKGQEPNNSNFEAIGKKIVEKCVGVPLAIRTIGRLLRLKDSEAEWLSFQNDEISRIDQNDESDILPTLKLSYDHLPPHLKKCFAFCRLFPKDYMIDIPTLIHFWIAQGFINLSHPKKCLEDVGHDYFMDLFWRSFFQKVEKDEWGNNGNKCKMHDLMHDLAAKVAGKESFTLDSKTENIDEKTRHVSFGFNLNSSSQIPNTLLKASRIRTFLLENQYEYRYYMDKSNFVEIVSKFRFLRMLEMNGTMIDTIPSCISKLKHLRYLDLSSNKAIKMLPNSITKLLNLQTLRLNSCSKLKKLPRDIGELVNLRCLDLSSNEAIKMLPDSITKLQNLQTLRLNSCSKLKELPRDIHKLVNLRCLENKSRNRLKYMPRGIGQLTNLQTLSRFEVGYKDCFLGGGLIELNGLNNLMGDLEIRMLGHNEDAALESKDANLKEKQHLQSLKLIWWMEYDASGYDEMNLKGFEPHPNLQKLEVENFCGLRFPNWLLSLSNLVKLSLYKCRKCQHLPSLDQLPHLKDLSLYEFEDLEYILESGSSMELSVSSFFPSLERLDLDSFPNLKGWWRNMDTVKELPSFPRLSSLRVIECPKLTSMPLFPYLERELYLDDVSIKPLHQTMMMKMNMESPKCTTASTATITSAPSTSSSTIATSLLAPLSNLKSLHLFKIKDLESLSEDWLRNLTSLEKLEIFRCHNLTSLPQGIRALTSLQRLEIFECHNLTSLPQGVRALTSLQRLQIFDCHNLTSLPQGMCDLTSLQRLEIWGCPTLSQRCKREVGEDWPNISHISDIRIY